MKATTLYDPPRAELIRLCAEDHFADPSYTIPPIQEEEEDW